MLALSKTPAIVLAGARVFALLLLRLQAGSIVFSEWAAPLPIVTRVPTPYVLMQSASTRRR